MATNYGKNFKYKFNDKNDIHCEFLINKGKNNNFTYKIMAIKGFLAHPC